MSLDKEQWETDKRREYWNSLKGKKGVDTPRWKGDKAGKTAVHKWLAKHFGRPSFCIHPDCNKKSKNYEWCKIEGRSYTHNSEDYIWLCKSCHRRYDLTPEKREKAIKNLPWWRKRNEQLV